LPQSLFRAHSLSNVVTVTSFDPSRRNTLAAASIKPSIRICSGSLLPPTKYYFGNGAQRGAGRRKISAVQLVEIEGVGTHGRFL
jgi:hypothetical protein